MKTLYFDGSNGAAGDMILGSLLMQVDQRAFLEQMGGFPEIQVHIEPVRAGEIRGLSVSILPQKDIQERHLRDIIDIILTSKLPPSVISNGISVFQELAGVEAQIHQTKVEQLHFHEVGALDSIGDIMGACLLLDMIGANRIFCSPLNLGTGKVECAHGVLSVPVPAVRAILRGVPTRAQGEGEKTTPTGAILMRRFARFCVPEEFVPVSVGVGFGKRITKDGGNYLKSVVY